MSEINELINQAVSYRDDLYNFVFRMTYDESLSEDIIQETYLRAIRHIDGFAGKCELKTWLFTIAKNEVYKRAGERKKHLGRLMEFREAENAAPQELPIVGYENEIYLDQIKNGCLFALLTCLPFSQRCAFILRVLNDLPIEVVAEVTGKSENAVRILATRAKAAIRRFLCTHCEHIEETPRCRCSNMLNFSIKNKLIRKIEARQVEQAKTELKRFRNELELLKSLPEKEWGNRIDLGPHYELIFSKK